MCRVRLHAPLCIPWCSLGNRTRLCLRNRTGRHRRTSSVFFFVRPGNLAALVRPTTRQTCRRERKTLRDDGVGLGQNSTLSLAYTTGQRNESETPQGGRRYYGPFLTDHGSDCFIFTFSFVDARPASVSVRARAKLVGLATGLARARPRLVWAFVTVTGCVSYRPSARHVRHDFDRWNNDSGLGQARAGGLLLLIPIVKLVQP
jgi:hypothetical protein